MTRALDSKQLGAIRTSLGIVAGQYSNKGLKEHNEDSIGIKVPDEPLLSSKGIVVAIADGVSGSSAGREASESCIKSLVFDYYSTPESWTVKNSCQKVLGAINRWLYGQSQVRHQLLGNGLLTTLSAIVFKSNTAHIFHVGDSRVYRLREGEFERLTRDHHRWSGNEKGFLSRAMGADVNVEIDYRKVDLQLHDTFILTTDGVHEFVRTKELIDIITANRTNPEKASREVVTKALENGSNDNVSCQIVTLSSLPHLDEESFFTQLAELPFPPPLESGMSLGGYRIVRELHASHRTQVYLAKEELTKRKVVLKTPSVNFEDDPVYIDGFLNEEWTGKRINNTHVLKVLPPVQSRKFLYYITEHVDGMSLREWMNDNPNPTLSEVRSIVDQLIKGVRAFQRLEMVHRDLKPENIMIDKDGTVKIIDFGSTKIAGIEEIHKPIDRNQLLGTLDYAAPEYFQGYSGSHQSDIYAVAVITYEMLCGKLPYGAPLSLKRIKKAHYVPASYHNPNVPDWVNAALEKGVKLNTSERYQALSEFYLDLLQPNEKILGSKENSLIDRNPVAFWQGIAVIMLICNIALVFILAR
ncbi:MAG: bifunctional protein-serine/threonine kinase/phosphatase [Gammaproteobacteria bacterium]|nr:bifunctional protein-serine/threonine kinase/phosphatase [Gammaproteobacteria bacterium]